VIVLVTGSPGWLGTRLVKYLCGKSPDIKGIPFIAEIDEIRCLVQSETQSIELKKIDFRIRTYIGDVSDMQSMALFFKGAHNAVLFHLAGIIHPTNGIKQLFEVNVKGIKNIINQSIKNSVKKIIAISSNSPLGVGQDNNQIFNEETPYNPYLAYGQSKMEMEILIKNAANNYDIEAVILRPCWFYGPGQPKRQSMFFSMIKNGKVPIVGDGNNLRSMSYVDNICYALILAAHNQNNNGKIYWIADEKPYSMNQIVDTIATLLDSEFNFDVNFRKIYLPNFMSTLAYGFDWSLQFFGMYNQKIHVLSEMNKTIACTIDKAKIELGYRPKVDLKKGMYRSIEWCLKNDHII
jgi:nucleoside-diphosphate-sugar epimerase